MLGHRLFRLTICGALLGVGSAPALGQGGLFERGRGVLKEFGVSVPGAAGLASGEIADGLREALTVGTGRVVGLLGVPDGFNGRPDIRIPLPGALGQVHRTLQRIGMGRLTEDLELRLNRAAETAVPKAKTLFLNAIGTMTIADARSILEGPDDAATRYFRGRMSGPLARDMKPIVEGELARAGAVQAYDRAIGRYKSIPFVPDAKADLTEHVLDKAIGGLFVYIAREEKAIRQDPAMRTTELLKKVFADR